jgi:hypothetical protein
VSLPNPFREEIAQAGHREGAIRELLALFPDNGDPIEPRVLWDGPAEGGAYVLELVVARGWVAVDFAMRSGPKPAYLAIVTAERIRLTPLGLVVRTSLEVP